MEKKKKESQINQDQSYKNEKKYFSLKCLTIMNKVDSLQSSFGKSKEYLLQIQKDNVHKGGILKYTVISSI